MDHAGVKVSRQRLQLLRQLKTTISLSDQTLNYTNKYQRTYKKVISEARKRENDRIILRSMNHTKALWQIIKKESGNCHKTNQNIPLEMGSLLVTNPQYIYYQCPFCRKCG
jgi:RNA polymerase-binding transcription factor DksA